MDPDELESEDLAVDAAAEREAAEGYGMAGLGQGRAIPAPQQFQLQGISDAQILKALGKNDVFLESGAWPHQRDEYRKQYMAAQGHMANASAEQYKAYVGAIGKQQARDDKIALAQGKLNASAQDPFIRAQRMYTMAGSLGGARTIAKSTGAALFQHGEVVDLGGGIAFTIAPTGSVRRVNPATGKEENISMSTAIAEGGVSVVPFLGGDEDAKGFRRMTAMANDVIGRLTQIEEIAKSPGAHSLYGTNAKDMLEQLESGLASSISQLRSGSKSMAGVSDKEMEAIAAGIPEASKLFSRDAGAITKAEMTRRQLVNLIMRQARANGVELNLINTTKKAGLKASQGEANQIPGVDLNPNGKQSGTSTPATAQPR